ncbi:glycosyltransferase family 2 protein [Paracholeplasma manati]|uniref:glycosyltransferase family 2 protein n=1 Tax=Paracholeplasma manati TaxID=591373 RepID=UPI0024088D87|nr:glycosyltransferase [Paracholeplasma manati]MDG0888952.1 glycosyltransferase [Paracholeplasma manati]
MISIIMSCFNAEKYIAETIKSIIVQTYVDFEFIIIDDNSDDKTVDIIKGFQDKRIRLFINEENRGLTVNLNFGLKQAKGEYIARVDSDDVFIKNKLEVQKKYFDRNPEVGLIGTNAYIYGTKKVIKMPITYSQILGSITLYNPFIHSSIMVKKDVIMKYLYNELFRHSQDYELWSRLVFNEKVININKPLLKYRIHENQISKKLETSQNVLSSEIKSNIIEKVMTLSENHKKIFINSLQLMNVKSVVLKDVKKVYQDIYLSHTFLDSNSERYFKKQLWSFYDRLTYYIIKNNHFKVYYSEISFWPINRFNLMSKLIWIKKKVGLK